MSAENKETRKEEAARAFVRALIKKHTDKYEPAESEIGDRCFKCLIGEHDSDSDDDDDRGEGYIFTLLKTYQPKTADTKPKTAEKLNALIAEFKKFVYRVKKRYKYDIIERSFRSYEKYKGKNEPLFSIHGERGEKMELLRADYYKQLIDGQEVNKQQIKDLRTAKALLIAEQKVYRRLTGELKQAQQTISQLRENNRELKSKYKALIHQKTKERQQRQPAKPRDKRQDEEADEEEQEQDEEQDESEEADEENSDEEQENEEQEDESEDRDSEEQQEGKDEGENSDNEGQEEGEENNNNNEGKQAIIEGEPDPPYMDEAEPGLLIPYIQSKRQNTTQDSKNSKGDHYII